MSRSKTVSDEQVLTTARKVFLREGVHAPVSAVAKELGVSVATLFFRTKTKDELLLRALTPPRPPALQMLQQLPTAGEDSYGRLMDILLNLNAYFSEVAPSAFLLSTAGFRPPKRLKPDDPPRALRSSLGRWLRRAGALGNIQVRSPRVVAELLISTLEARHLKAYSMGRKYSSAQDRAFLKSALKFLIEQR